MLVGDLVFHTRHGGGCVAAVTGPADRVVQFLSGVRVQVKAAELLVWLRAHDPTPLEESVKKEFPLLTIRCLAHWLILGDAKLADRASAFLVATDNPDWLAKAYEEVGTWPDQSRRAAIERLDRASVAMGRGAWSGRVERLIAERAEADRRRELRASLRGDWSALASACRSALQVLEETDDGSRDDGSAGLDGEYWADRFRSVQPGDEEVRARLAAEARRVEEVCGAILPQLAAGSSNTDLNLAAQQLAALRASFQPVGSWITEHDERRARVERARLLTDRINEARQRRGDPVLDRREMDNVLRNLNRRAADPTRYRNHCWQCEAVVDAATNEGCLYCHWLVCWCGACRSPEWRGDGRSGRCRTVVWGFADRYELPDYDHAGEPILTATRPSRRALEVRAVLARHHIGRLLHWTPARNAQSILERGVLSRDLLLERGIPFVPHGYGSVEKELLLGGYVALSFAQKNAMMDAWSEQPVVFEISPEVALADSTLFVPGNSASRDIDLDLRSLEGPDSLERVFAYPSGPAVPQAEVWVPKLVARIAITAVFVPTDELRVLLEGVLVTSGRDRITRVEVRPRLAALA